MAEVTSTASVPVVARWSSQGKLVDGGIEVFDRGHRKGGQPQEHPVGDP